MYSFNDLAKMLHVSEKTVRRRVKSEGIKYVDKDARTMLFDDKALAILRNSLATANHKHELTVKAGKANTSSANSKNNKIKIQKLLIRLDETGRTLASDQYLTSIAERVIDMLNNNSDVKMIVTTLNDAINRSQLIDDRYDDLTEQISNLNDRIDNLYDKLVHNIKSFNYKKMAKINAQVFLQVVDKKGK